MLEVPAWFIYVRDYEKTSHLNHIMRLSPSFNWVLCYITHGVNNTQTTFYGFNYRNIITDTYLDTSST